MDQSIPVLIHANAGMPVYSDGKTTFPETPAEMAGYVKEIIEAGANIIGGCCGTTPEHISEIIKIVKSF
jgi:5-methyltetrahydrofolate--homocysteine methyltransferase